LELQDQDQDLVAVLNRVVNFVLPLMHYSKDVKHIFLKWMKLPTCQAKL